MIVGFHINSLDTRGNGEAVYNYAHYNETILGNTSVILYKADAPDNWPGTIARYQARFGNRLQAYRGFAELNLILRSFEVAICYVVKSGEIDELHHQITACPCANHAVFQWGKPHGFRYAYVSPWLAKIRAGVCVPPIIHPTRGVPHLREELKIPTDVTVFGRHGGYDSFDVVEARRIVREIADEKHWFIFLQTEKFCEHPNVIFIPTTDDLAYIDRFILTCDAMLHGRHRGETFGVSCAQFNAAGRHVFSYGLSEERAHFDILRGAITPYATAEELGEMLIIFARHCALGWRPKAVDLVTSLYAPEVVMQQFQKVFLE